MTSSSTSPNRLWTAPFIKGIFALGCLQVAAILALNWGGLPKDRAIILMATGLWLIWCLGFGVASWRLRDRVREAFEKLPGSPFLPLFWQPNRGGIHHGVGQLL